jgi:hypothetical protein
LKTTIMLAWLISLFMRWLEISCLTNWFGSQYETKIELEPSRNSRGQVPTMMKQWKTSSWNLISVAQADP